jgi:uncharacterized membrane protein YoaK (UPF0700 family)
LLLIFALAGRHFTDSLLLTAIILLCFSMGLQNAMITKISGSVIRTTHLTGLVTDIGIAMGRLFYASQHADVHVREELCALRLLASLVVLFFTGGVVGALGFQRVGFFFTIPLSAMLVLLAITPLIDDLRRTKLLPTPPSR